MQTTMENLAQIGLRILRFVAGLVDDDYDVYVRRRRAEHPNLPVMTHDEFIERK